MAKFCGKCGTPLGENSAFCSVCGAPAPNPAPPFESTPATPYQTVPQPPVYANIAAPPPPNTPPPQPTYAAYPPAPPAKSSNAALKIVLIVLAVFALGAFLILGGMLYMGHKVVSKIQDKAAEAGLSSADLNRTGPAFHGDACRFLSKEEVSDAIGVTIVETQSSGDGCSYLAQGTAADMTSKHLSEMMSKHGADKQQQEMIAKMAGGLFAQQQHNAAENDPEAAKGTTPVLAVSIDSNAARSQMKLNSKVLGALGSASGSSHIEGIGDEAFVAADGMMLVRKGDTLMRITYISCPCNTDQIKPLARKLAAAF